MIKLETLSAWREEEEVTIQDTVVFTVMELSSTGRRVHQLPPRFITLVGKLQKTA